MLRKMFLAFALAASLIAAAPMAPASAQSYYMGTYSDDGSDAYLLSETVKIYDYSPLRFNCTVYCGDYLYYSFFQRNGRPYYRNSQGYEAYVFGGDSPIAANIYRFVANNF